MHTCYTEYLFSVFFYSGSMTLLLFSTKQAYSIFLLKIQTEDSLKKEWDSFRYSTAAAATVSGLLGWMYNILCCHHHHFCCQHLLCRCFAAFLNSPELILIVRESGPVAHPHQQERSEKPRIIKRLQRKFPSNIHNSSSGGDGGPLLDLFLFWFYLNALLPLLIIIIIIMLT